MEATTETAKPRKSRSDKGLPRKPRERITPEMLRARADEMEREHAARAEANLAKLIVKASSILERAAEIAPEPQRTHILAAIHQLRERHRLGTGE